jgi:hypothetical protein
MSLALSSTKNLGRCPPTKHSFVEHSKSAKIFCVNCSFFVGSPTDIAVLGSEKLPSAASSPTISSSSEDCCEAASHAFTEHSKSGRLFCAQCGTFAGHVEDIAPVDHVKAFLTSTKQGAIKLGDNAKEGAKKLGDGAKKMTETVKVGSLRLGGQFPSFGRNKAANNAAGAAAPDETITYGDEAEDL